MIATPSPHIEPASFAFVHSDKLLLAIQAGNTMRKAKSSYPFYNRELVINEFEM